MEKLSVDQALYVLFANEFYAIHVLSLLAWEKLVAGNFLARMNAWLTRRKANKVSSPIPDA